MTARRLRRYGGPSKIKNKSLRVSNVSDTFGRLSQSTILPPLIIYVFSRCYRTPIIVDYTFLTK